MTIVTLVVHNQRENAADLAKAASTWLLEHGHEVRMPERDAEAVGLPELGAPREKLTDGVGLAVSLGGDGTMLRTVDLVESAEVPVLGVNVGVLGYLTEVEPHAMTSAFERFFAGDHEIDDRMMLSVTVRSSVVPARRGLLPSAQRGGRGEDAVGPHRAHARAHRGRGVHLLCGRWAHRRDADRLDRVFAFGPRSDRVAAPSRAACSPRFRRTCSSTVPSSSIRARR